MADELIFDGEVMPMPKLEGITVSQEKIWSKNTGRTANLQMVGDIKGIKKTIRFEWAILSPSQAALIDSKISNPAKPFVPIVFTDQFGIRRSTTVYFGTPTYKIYSYIDGKRYITNVTVDAIEK